MRSIAFDRVHQIRDEIIAALELDINVRPSFFGAINQPDKAIIRSNEPDNEKRDYPK